MPYEVPLPRIVPANSFPIARNEKNGRSTELLEMVIEINPLPSFMVQKRTTLGRFQMSRKRKWARCGHWGGMK